MAFTYSELQSKGAQLVRQFGSSNLIDTADVPVDIWSYADAEPVYTFPSNSGETLYISSSSALDTMQIQIIGLDADFREQIVTVAVTGQQKKEISGTWTRVNKIINIGSSDVAGVVYVYTNTTVTLGVPQTNSAVKSLIENGFNESLFGIYSVPAGKTFYVTSYHLSCDAKNNNTFVNSTISFNVRFDPDKVFRTQEIIAVSNYSPAIIMLDTPFPIMGPADIQPQVRSFSLNNVEFHCVLEGLML